MGNDNTVSYGTYPQMLGEPITKEVFDKFRGNWEMPSGVVKVCQPEKHFCSYCQSTSHDDMRGNCCCCGAPRGNDKYVRLWKNESTMNAEWFNQLSGWRI